MKMIQKSGSHTNNFAEEQNDDDDDDDERSKIDYKKQLETIKTKF